MVALFLRQVQVAHGALHILGRGGLHPAVDRLVVVGAHVGDAVVRVAVGAVVAAVAAVKGELQHLHAGVAALFQQGVDILGQKAQILRDNAGAAQLFLDGGKQRIAGAFAPAAMLGGLVAVGDGVISRETAEVVDAHHIIDAAHMADAAHPPGITGLGHSVPVKQRVAPQLAGGREAVWRAACHLGGQQVFVQLELLRAAPHIDAVQRDVNRQIADNVDLHAVGVAFQRVPLGVEQVLHHLPESHIVGVLLAGRFQGLRLAAAQRLFPLKPAGPAVGVLQCHEQRVVRQPKGVFLHELAVGGVGLCQQTVCRAAQHLVTFFVQSTVVDGIGGGFPIDVLIFLGQKQAAFGKLVEIDKIRVARKRREGLIGAVAVAGGADG